MVRWLPNCDYREPHCPSSLIPSAKHPLTRGNDRNLNHGSMRFGLDCSA